MIYLSSTDIGISKNESPLEVILKVNHEKLSNLLQEMWAKQQYDMLHFNLIQFCHSDKRYLQDYYAKPDQIKKQDKEELLRELKYLCNYTPLTYDNSEKIKSYETFIIPKIMYSKTLYYINE